MAPDANRAAQILPRRLVAARPRVAGVQSAEEGKAPKNANGRKISSGKEAALEGLCGGLYGKLRVRPCGKLYVRLWGRPCGKLYVGLWGKLYVRL